MKRSISLPLWTIVALGLWASSFTAAASSVPAVEAPEQQPKAVYDPWEGFNRAMFAVNEGLDRVIIKPVAQIYEAVLPDLLQRGVRNFFSNLADPWIGVNNLLQGKVGEAFSDWMRFGVNTTFGLFGLLDIASEAGLPKHNEDLGQTLAYWGVGSGPYLVLPLIGPRTLRDALVWPVDRLGMPSAHLADDSARFALQATEVVAVRASLLVTDEQKERALDPYAFVRDAYWQRRQYLIFDGNPPVVYERFE